MRGCMCAEDRCMWYCGTVVLWVVEHMHKVISTRWAGRGTRWAYGDRYCRREIHTTVLLHALGRAVVCIRNTRESTRVQGYGCVPSATRLPARRYCAHNLRELNRPLDRWVRLCGRTERESPVLARSLLPPPAPPAPPSVLLAPSWLLHLALLFSPKTPSSSPPPLPLKHRSECSPPSGTRFARPPA